MAGGEAFARALGVCSVADARAVAGSACAALAAALGDARFLGGAAPSDADAALFAQCAVALHAPWPEPLVGDAVRAHATLVAHERRMRQLCFGDNAPRPPPPPDAELARPDAFGRFAAWHVPLFAPRHARLSRAEYERKRGNFFFVCAAAAVMGTFFVTSRFQTR